MNGLIILSLYQKNYKFGISSKNFLKEYRSAKDVMKTRCILFGTRESATQWSCHGTYFFCKMIRFYIGYQAAIKTRRTVFVCERLVFTPCIVPLQQRRLSSIYVAWTPIIQDPMVVSSNAYVFNNPLHLTLEKTSNDCELNLKVTKSFPTLWKTNLFILIYWARFLESITSEPVAWRKYLK